jgi:tRNA threonylcarbamoyladenosine biosynthesis protein TsaE
VITLALPDLDATRRLAMRLAADLEAGETLLLDGPLGSGKTTLVRFLVEGLGGDPAQVLSPTFTLLHQYSARLPVVHVDAYRLDGPGGLAGLGFEELAEPGIGVIEWAARVDEGLDARRCWRVALEHRPAGGRQAVVTTPSRREGKW